MKDSTNRKIYYTIGEVSDLLGIPDYVIRFWENEIPEIAPKRRGKNRVYTSKDIEKLKLVKYLVYEKKFTLEGARQELKSKKKKQDIQPTLFDIKSKQENLNILLEIKDFLNEIKNELDRIEDYLDGLK